MTDNKMMRTAHPVFFTDRKQESENIFWFEIIIFKIFSDAKEYGSTEPLTPEVSSD
jgi:hypothetical protein